MEPRAVIRRGDISLDGLFVEIDREVGEPGTVHRLRMRSRDKAVRLAIEARVARVTRSDDLLHGSQVTGVGFELLAYDAETRAALDHFLAHVAKKRLTDLADAASEELEVAGLSVETSWALRKGERVGIEVPSPSGGCVRYEGQAVRSRRGKSGRWRTRVSLTGEASDSDEPRHVGGIREALTEVPTAHLSGDLSRFRMPTLLTLADLERTTGELRIHRGPQQAIVYLHQGRVVDVEGLGLPREQQLAALCGWTQGAFELFLRDVDRPDLFGLPTTALLIDLARAHDEAQRVA